MTAAMRQLASRHYAPLPGLTHQHGFARRVRERRGHFARPALLDSQLAPLEQPREAIKVDVAAPPEEIIATIRERLGAGDRP
jgi:gluconate kinase